MLVYHRGEEFYEHEAGTPGLIAAFKAGGKLVTSGEDWKVSRHPAFRSGHCERMTRQIHSAVLSYFAIVVLS